MLIVKSMEKMKRELYADSWDSALMVLECHYYKLINAFEILSRPYIFSTIDTKWGINGSF